MGRGPAETKRQMESIDSILDFVVGNRELGLLMEEDVESRKKFKTYSRAGFLAVGSIW